VRGAVEEGEMKTITVITNRRYKGSQLGWIILKYWFILERKKKNQLYILGDTIEEVQTI